jgi:DNA polymerase-1
MTNNGTDDKRLFLLDAYALIFRGYYALIKNPRINSAGMDTSAIMGFTNSLFDVIRREKPEYLAVAFDKGGSHERVELYQDYKNSSSLYSAYFKSHAYSYCGRRRN